MNRGFTLIELLAATALTALLAVGVLAVIGQLRPARAAALVQAAAVDDTDVLLAVFRHDLLHADIVRQEQNLVVLESRAALEPKTLAWRHRPVRVLYTLQQVNGLPCLTRRQQQVDEPMAKAGGWGELVCCGVESFDLRDGGGSPLQGPASVPDCVQVRLTWQETQRAAVEEVLCLK